MSHRPSVSYPSPLAVHFVCLGTVHSSSVELLFSHLLPLINSAANNTIGTYISFQLLGKHRLLINLKMKEFKVQDILCQIQLEKFLK